MIVQASLSIRQAETPDLAGLQALYRELSPEDPEIDTTTAETRFQTMLSHPGMRVFIGFSGGTAAATVTLVILPNLTRGGASYALIENVVTSAKYRKRGYAAALLRHAIDAAWVPAATR